MLSRKSSVDNLPVTNIWRDSAQDVSVLEALYQKLDELERYRDIMDRTEWLLHWNLTSANIYRLGRLYAH
jgi:hypothetical protein